MDNIDKLKAKIKLLYLQGYTPREIVKLVDNELTDIDIKTEDYKYKYVLGTVNNIRNIELTFKQREEVDRLKKERSQNKQDDIEAGNLDLIEKRIVELYTTTYKNAAEIIKDLKDELTAHYSADENYCYSFAISAINKYLRTLSKEEKEALNEKRRHFRKSKPKVVLGEELDKEIASNIKKRIELNEESLQRPEAYSKAIQTIAAEYRINLTNAVKLFKKYYPDLYGYYVNREYLTPEYFIEMAEKIIERDIPFNTAFHFEGYSVMITYLKNNRPDLYEKIKSVYASHKVNTQFNRNEELNGTTDFKNLSILVDIALEFRVPLPTLCEFINSNKDVFFTKDMLLNEDELLNLLKRIIYNNYPMSTVEWLITDMCDNNAFVDYRILRFKEFASVFAKLKDDQKRLDDYMNKVVNGVFIDSTKPQSNPENARAVSHMIYKYGLTSEEIANFLGVPRVDKKRLEEILDQSTDIADQALSDGMKRLSAYNLANNQKYSKNARE